MDELILKAGGVAFGGWKEISVRLSIESVSGTFRVRATEKYPGPLPQRKLVPGLACAVELGGETVITGWIDGVAPAYTHETHEVTVSGRDRAGDLVDCAAVHSPGEWRGLRMERLVAIFAEPFGVTVRARVDTGSPFEKFTLDKGETAHEAIERMARQRAVLVVSDGQGGLEITRAAEDRVGLRLETGGPWILAGRGVLNHSARFSEYRLLAQRPGNDFLGGRQAAQVVATATDPGVRRYRPYVAMAEDPPGGTTLAERARWEANVRAGRSQKATLTVRGWRTGRDGPLWRPNRRVHVKDTFLGIDRELLISGVEFSAGPGGRRAVLDLVRPEAFELVELPDASGGEELVDPSGLIPTRLKPAPATPRSG